MPPPEFNSPQPNSVESFNRRNLNTSKRLTYVGVVLYHVLHTDNGIENFGIDTQDLFLDQVQFYRTANRIGPEGMFFTTKPVDPEEFKGALQDSLSLLITYTSSVADGTITFHNDEGAVLSPLEKPVLTELTKTLDSVKRLIYSTTSGMGENRKQELINLYGTDDMAEILIASAKQYRDNARTGMPLTSKSLLHFLKGIGHERKIGEAFVEAFGITVQGNRQVFIDEQKVAIAELIFRLTNGTLEEPSHDRRH